GPVAGPVSAAACVSTRARSSSRSARPSTVAKLRALARPARRYGAGADRVPRVAAGYHAIASIWRALPFSNGSVASASVTTHRVVATGSDPVGAGSVNTSEVAPWSHASAQTQPATPAAYPTDRSRFTSDRNCRSLCAFGFRPARSAREELLDRGD